MKIGDREISIKALQTFEVTARHLHMGKAAKELSVTQSAVSHQVRRLEEELDLKLFDRTARQLQFTPTGRHLFETVNKSFDAISAAALQLGDRSFEEGITLAAPPAILALWLTPRIGDFLLQYPKLNINIKTAPLDRNHSLPEADIIIQWSRRHHKGRDITDIGSLSYAALCSPTLVNAFGRLDSYSLKQTTLIHDDRGGAWGQMLSKLGLAGIEPLRNIYVDNAAIALQLAAGGVGVAINDLLISHDLIEQGKLVLPIEERIEGFDHFFLVSRPADTITRPQLALKNWLVQQLKACVE
jgi:LysR family transcriptional regulator, glycine cleavage system transcriptional activator